MFSVIALRRIAKVDVVQTEEEFWKRFEHYIHHFDLSTQELETAHGECDLRLVDKIFKVIEPVLGPDGIDGQPWHHNLDFYGDGVRLIEVDSTRFTSTVIAPLHALLSGEHERFCILCKYFRNFTDEPLQQIGVLSIFNSRIIMTHSLVDVLEHA